MKYTLWVFVAVLMVITTSIKADKNFSLTVEVENNTLDLSDPNLPKGYDEASYYFWVNAVITNESMYPKKLTIWSCNGAGFKVEPKYIRNVVKCKKNYPKTILLQPKESYKIPLYLSFKKNYTGDTLKFRISYPMAAIDWSEFITIKLKR